MLETVSKKKGVRAREILCGILLAVLYISPLSAGERADYSSVYQEIKFPRIEVTPLIHNFGRVFSKPVNHTFLVKNTGEAPLVIFHVSTSCGCTTASIDKKMIRPGETAEMIVTYDPNTHPPKKQGNVATAKKVRRFVYIRNNDPKTPEQTVQITVVALN